MHACRKDTIKLRGRSISDAQFYRKAAALKLKIMAAMEADANDEAIRTYQDIFRTNKEKMYHWADDRRVPAHNNTAERELRPTVIARKVSFGSQGDKGRKTREVLASVLNTLALRGGDPAAALKDALDRLAVDKNLDPHALLFGEPPPVEKAQARAQLDAPPQHHPPTEADTSTGRTPSPRHPSHKPALRTVAAAVALLFFLFFVPPAFRLGGTTDSSAHQHPGDSLVVASLSTSAAGNADETPRPNSTPSHVPRNGPPLPRRSRPPPIISRAPAAQSPLE